MIPQRDVSDYPVLADGAGDASEAHTASEYLLGDRIVRRSTKGAFGSAGGNSGGSDANIALEDGTAEAVLVLDGIDDAREESRCGSRRRGSRCW